ncbi:response regulator [Devosia submarina]|uniref:response regulator n=1 Tax=Devosia submarina TaxID=1173082 RepID=UPI000D3349D8|nr:response regulator [Devosia submarina]
MSDPTPLQGRSVLVVDDDFFLAMDACSTLQEAAATIIGPFGRATDALNSLKNQRPDLAIVDLNLGSGPNFELARTLADAGIPTVIMTGYDKDVIPPDLTHLPCLQKPLDMGQLISTCENLLQ